MGLSGNVSGSVGGSIIFDGGTGTDDYRELTHKPSINGVPLNGALTSEDLHIPTDAVEDVKVNGNSVVSGGVANITINPDPVTDVKVNGQSVMSGTVANIEESVQDVKVDGNSVVSNHSANIHIPVVDVEVNHMSVVSHGVAEIDITPAPVQDVKVNGQSVLFNRVANISVPSVPVQDVTVNGQSVMDGTTAKVLVPAPPVTDVSVDGVSVMDGTVAKVISPSVPVQDVTVNGQSVMDGTTAKVLVPAPPVTDVKVNNQTVVSQGVANISITPPPVTDVQLNGQSVLVGTIANVAPKASDVAINPPIPGISASNCWEGLSELKGTLGDKLDVTTMFPLTSISDCNLAKSNGIYYYNASSANAPTTNGGIIFACITQPAQNQGFQIAYPNNQNFVAMRVLNASVFGNWQPIINAGNINSYITTTTAFPMTISNKTGTSDCVIDTQNCYMKNNTAYIAMTLHSVSNTSDIEISLPSGKKFKQIGAIGTCGKGNRWDVTGAQYVFVGERNLSLNTITANTYYHLILALPLQ